MEHSEQAAPIPNAGRPIWELVIEDGIALQFLPGGGEITFGDDVGQRLLADMRARDALGRQKYGTALQAHNGRDVLRDAYEEALDLVVYLRQAIAEGYDEQHAFEMAMLVASALCASLIERDAESAVRAAQ